MHWLASLHLDITNNIRELTLHTGIKTAKCIFCILFLVVMTSCCPLWNIKHKQNEMNRFKSMPNTWLAGNVFRTNNKSIFFSLEDRRKQHTFYLFK